MAAVEFSSTLRRSMSDCFDSGLYSDLRIKDSNGHEYAVHRIIVCGQSNVLANACKPEHGFKEAHTGVIDLEHDNPDSVKAMLEYMYHGFYTIRDSTNAMLEHACAYAIGEIYCITELKDFAADRFNTLSSKGWGTDDFVAAVRVIYESIPDTDTGGIREIISSVVAEHYVELLGKPEFKAVLDDFGALGKDVLLTLALVKAHAEAPKLSKYGCRRKRNFHIVQMTLDHRLPETMSKCSICGVSRLNKDWAYLIQNPESENEF